MKIVATRFQVFRLKCTKFVFGWGSARPTSWIKGSTYKESVGEGEEGTGRGGEWRGREGEGSGGEGARPNGGVAQW